MAKIALGLVILGTLLWLGRSAGGRLPQVAAWVESLGVWGPLAFIGIYAAATVVFVPGSLLTLAAGAIFGLARGTAYVFVGACLGAIAAFLIARYLARTAVERRLARHARFERIDRAIGGQGTKVVLLLRLSPVFPFNLLNYALGLTRVRLRDYLVGCLGMLPGTFLYVYYGKALGSVVAIAGGAKVARGPGYWVILGLGLAATVAVTALATRIARRALAEEVDDDG